MGEPDTRLNRQPDQRGRFGPYGGSYVPETLMHALAQLDQAYHAAKNDPEFQRRLATYLAQYAGRPRRCTSPNA